jgi:nucleoside-triphosphatase THEP1
MRVANSNSVEGPSNLLLTGASGIGKSTLLRKLATKLQGWRLGGFVSEAILEGDQRVGWRIDSFDGDGGVVAHTSISREVSMGRFGVDMALFERMVADHLKTHNEIDVYLVDEIGIIASWSELFIKRMNILLDSDHLVVAIVRQKSNDYVGEVKARADTDLWEITRENRDTVLGDVLSWIIGRKVI